MAKPTPEEVAVIMAKLSATPRTAAINTREASVYSGLSESTLEKARTLGGGPLFSRLVNRAIRYRMLDIDLYMESRRARSTSDYGD